jgi:hypothetical protein
MEDFIKDFINDWLYIIVIAVVAIGSFFGKKNKDKGAQNKQDTPPPQDWWSEIFGEKKPEPEPVKRPAQNIESKPKPAYQGINPVDMFMNPENEGVRSIETFENEAGHHEEKNIGFALDDMPKDLEQWRKALIYNEIFNRKY